MYKMSESAYQTWLPKMEKAQDFIKQGLSRREARTKAKIGNTQFYAMVQKMKQNGSWIDHDADRPRIRRKNKIPKKRKYNKRSTTPEMLTLTVQGHERKWSPNELGEFLKTVGVI